MLSNRNSRYPSHLARLVAARLRERNIVPPAEKTLLRLLETMYFASLKTEELRPCLCTINFADPHANQAIDRPEGQAGRWTATRFRQPVPLDVHSLTKLAEAADPAVSSLAVFHDESGGLFIWGMVDQELRYSDRVAVNAESDWEWPGLFQATITKTGSLSVYKDYLLLGSLERNSLIAAYHDVLWQGPVHKRLRANLRSTLTDPVSPRRGTRNGVAQVKDELLVRWQNAICRVLLNIQQYGQGGGLLIVPRCPAEQVNVEYHLRYDRLPRALFGLAKYQLLTRQTTDNVAHHLQMPNNRLPGRMHFETVEYRHKLEEHERESLGCIRFIASLSRVDGFVLLDRSLVVHGFGVEARADCDLTDVYIAGDAKATPRLLRQATLNQFGTRHRAMMRYCHGHAGTLGFVISQDGDIRATMQVKNRLVLWENINVQIGFRRENRVAPFGNIEPVTGLFQFWSELLTNLRSA